MEFVGKLLDLPKSQISCMKIQQYENGYKNYCHGNKGM